MRILKQSTATTLLLGPFVDSTDGFTAETALTVSQADVLLWKEGGTTLAQKNEATTCTHRSNGLYTCPVNTTDTNTLGILTVSVSESGALPVRHDFYVVPANIYDSLVLGTDTQDVQVTGIGNNVIAAAAIASGAITAAKFAADAITATVLADNAITASKLASNAITSAKVATDAIGAAQLAADAVSEIQSGLASQASVNTIDDFLDTEVAAIKAVTDKLDSALELDGGPYRFTSNALEQAPTSAAAGTLASGTAQAGGASTITLQNDEPTTEDLFRLCTINTKTGTGALQSRQITGYSTGRIATVNEPWEVIPDNTTTYEIIGNGIAAATLEDIEGAVWDADPANHLGSNTYGGEGVPADLKKISGDSTAADALESLLDGTAGVAIRANIKYINDLEIDGDGDADPFHVV